MAWQKCLVLRKMCWSVTGVPCQLQQFSIGKFKGEVTLVRKKKKKKAVKAIFLMLVGEGPVKEIMIQ